MAIINLTICVFNPILCNHNDISWSYDKSGPPAFISCLDIKISQAVRFSYLFYTCFGFVSSCQFYPHVRGNMGNPLIVVGSDLADNNARVLESEGGGLAVVSLDYVPQI